MANRKDWLPNPSTWKNTWRDDWRIMGQEGYLMGKSLQYRKFRKELCHEDYDQCDFCWECFDRDNSTPMHAYFVPEERLWICERCYKDFREHFQWTVEEIDD